MSEVLDRPSVRRKTQYKVIGQPLPRVDGLGKVTGVDKFAADYSLPGMLVAKVVRSPHAHARITRIDASKAEAYPGVGAVLTGADLEGIEREPTSRQHNVVARTQVLFAGQPVAAVAAVTREIAEEAVGLIEVEYEVLPPLLDPLESMRKGAPTIVHEGSEAGVHIDRSEEKIHAGGAGALEEQDETAELNNVSSQVHFKRGDVEQGFKEADAVVEGRWISSSAHQSYLEPHATLASWDAAGNLTIWCSTQAQFHIRDSIARMFMIPISKVRVTGTEIGGGFGAKFGVMVPLCVLLSRKAGRPVKWVLSRSEELIGATPAPHTVIDVKLGAKRDGTLTAMKARVVMDTGAFPGAPMSIGTILLAGSYKIPNFELDGYEVLTNKASVGAYRAPGAPNVAFGVEAAVDLLAKELGISPLEFRIKNAIEEGDKWPNGNALPLVGARDVLLALKNHPISRQPLGPNQGRGYALGGWPGGAGAASAYCRANPDGTFTVITGTINLTGSTTSLAQIAAEELGVPLGLVSIVTGDTSESPHSPAAGGSQIVYTMGHAVSRAARDCREQMLDLAARHLGVGKQQLRIEDGLVKARNGKAVTYKRLADQAMQGPGPVVGQGSHRPGRPFPGFAATCAIVQVDPDTGQPRVNRIVTAQDAGLAINPMAVEGQIQGGTVQGIGMALTEEVVYNADGRVANPGLLDYRLLTFGDVPEIEAVIVEVPAEAGPYGARIVGEPPIVPPGAAVGNAVMDAIGKPVYVFPATPERIFNAMHSDGRSG
ncbi:MAG TPA: xanthine dehydrogenase family protein molybdopterin-binding subunit [Chloroflexota bacterium]|nr:xanthine dehydrogenase family protein molybdopterin-binding subunit [Chloroflexota bacterium]